MFSGYPPAGSSGVLTSTVTTYVPAATGASVEPRKGFFTTTFKINDVIYTLSDKTIYFYDASLGRHIFIDFLQTTNSETPLIISADFDIENKYLTNAELITKFDWSALIDYNIRTYRDISFLQDKAELAIDKYGINRYIINAEHDYDGIYFRLWVSFVYRKNGSTYKFYGKEVVAKDEKSYYRLKFKTCHQLNALIKEKTKHYEE